MTVKGDLELDIDEQGIEVRVTITPDENGGEITPESIRAMLIEKKVRTALDTEAMDKAFRTLARKGTEPVSFVAAAGVPPQPATPEAVVFEPAPIPARLAAVSRSVVGGAPQARGFRLREERYKTEKKVLRKGALPFLPGKEEIQVVVEKRSVREEVPIDPAVLEEGFVTRGSVVARMKPGKQGREGHSVFGRLVPAPRPVERVFLFLGGLTRAGAEVRAEVTGFLRTGAGWCDVVPFEDHVVEVSRSPDRLTCLLHFTPGAAAAPAPDPDEVLARAAALGFDAASMMSSAEIAVLLGDAIARGTPVVGRSLTPRYDGQASIDVSEDRLRATMSLRKGRGGGVPLASAMVSNAIRASRVRGYNLDAIRRDLKAFLDSPDLELTGYLLATGTPPKPGRDSKLDWGISFLPQAELEAVRATAEASAEALSTIASLRAFPLSQVEAVARVKPEVEVLKITPPAGGTPGVDVYGAAVAPGGGTVADVRLFEGLQLRKGSVFATAAGILEKGSEGMAVLLRARPHRDAELRVTIAQDRMKASISWFPPEGDGAGHSAGDVRERIRQAGVQRGILEDRLRQALDRIARGEPLADFLVAEGTLPRYDTSTRVNFHVRLATGRVVTFRADGSADFRAQDKMTRVRGGELIATLRPRDPRAEDGWDVTGGVLAPPPEAQETLEAGKGVRGNLQTDGTTRFFAEAAGELSREGSLLSVMDSHVVEGDVDMSTGNVSFPGNVRVGGTVRAGFRVMAGGVLDVEGMVEGALLSSEGGIAIGQGIKGEGRAILRARRGIESLFAEQAALLAVGDVHLHGPCLRCQVKCNGRLVLDSEKGSLVGGEVRASRGIEVQNVGSVGGIRTVVSFGQDFLVKDQIERAERDVESLAQKIESLNEEMHRLEQAARGAAVPPQSPLGRARAGKVAAMKLLDQRKLQLIALHDKYDEHVESAIIVRGTLYPGAVLESHGRRYETRTEKKMIALHFDPAQGRIVEKL